MTSPLAVSLGDPAGIGPELAVKAFVARSSLGLPPFVVHGDPGVLERAAARSGETIRIRTMTPTEDAGTVFASALPVSPVPLARAETPGTADPDAAPMIIGAIEAGVAAVRTGAARALVTLPIAKSSLYAAGFAFPGHTEFVAHLTADLPHPGERGPVMMLAGPRLRVALATIHTPLMQVASALTVARIVAVGRVVAEALRRDFSLQRPRIAIAGLNPHAGESGSLGREEIDVIAPAVAALRSEGVDVRGPLSADALFHEEARASYDAAIAMFHDQGLIPVKTLDFWETVNVTLGLPIVRTSPDHGVAYDLAGRGLARIDSFVAALRLADQMAAARARA